MSAMTTLAPASASAVAIPRPMPDAAPVTIAVLPEMSIYQGTSITGVSSPIGQRGSPTSRRLQAIHPCCGATVERFLFAGRRVGGDTLEGVPQLGVAARLLVRRKVAF